MRGSPFRRKGGADEALARGARPDRCRRCRPGAAAPPQAELAEYLATVDLEPDGYLFPGRDGRRRDRHAVRNRVLYPAIERANEVLEAKGFPTISSAVTFHSLRRTYASLCAEAGVDPAWTAAQIGQRDARFTLNVYTDVDHRRQSAAAQLGRADPQRQRSPIGHQCPNGAAGARGARGRERL